MYKLFFLILSTLALFACSDSPAKCESFVSSTSDYVFDSSRNRQIPIQTYALSDTIEWNGELVILSAGYGSSNTEYSYISERLAANGFYVVCIQHEIQTDSLLPSGDDIIKLRMPNWTEGVKSLEQVLTSVKKKAPSISTEKIHLIGHSNGGDISVLFATKNSDRVMSLVTLDHRRMPIPLTQEYSTLSFRADQFEADTGVIPSKADQIKYPVNIVYLENVDHNYLRDIATKETKEKVISEILEHLEP